MLSICLLYCFAFSRHFLLFNHEDLSVVMLAVVGCYLVYTKYIFMIILSYERYQLTINVFDVLHCEIFDLSKLS